MISVSPPCVSFTGHRSYRGQADGLLSAAVAELVARGMTTFLSGMARGFDLAAAGAVVECRRRFPQVRLVAVVPFEGQELRFPAADRMRYHRLLAEADVVTVLAPAYYRGCYAVRNNYLVEHASLLVSWCDGSPGGTSYTVDRALKRGVEVWNLHPTARLVLHPVDPTLF